MRYREFNLGDPLRSFIQCFWTLEAASQPTPEIERILPDGCPELVFHFADRFRQLDDNGLAALQPHAFLVGQMRRHLLIQPTGRIGVLGVRFRTAGAAAFFRTPLRELTGHIAALDLLWGGLGRRLEAQMGEATTLQDRLRILARALSRQLAAGPQPDPVVRAAVAMVRSANGTAAIDQVARQVGLSRRQLERKFRHQVGLTPKELSRLARFQRLVRAARNFTAPDWASLALACGYADQAHGIREFKEFAGQTPAAFFREQHAMSDFFIPPDAPA